MLNRMKAYMAIHHQKLLSYIHGNSPIPSGVISSGTAACSIASKRHFLILSFSFSLLKIFLHLKQVLKYRHA